MKLTDFNYHLPKDHIALFPPSERGDAKLLVVDRKQDQLEHRAYDNVINYLNPGDIVILNDTKVLPARVIVQDMRGKNIELVILEKHLNTEPGYFYAIYRGHLTTGDQLSVGNDLLTVIEITNEGTAKIASDLSVEVLTNTYGQVPIPPYLHREAEAIDKDRYQTEFAKVWGSVAAPTASLNFTNQLQQQLKNNGVAIHFVTLHVGMGTFLPIRSEEIENHHMHQEAYHIPSDTIEAIITAKNNHHRVVAIGTTVTRALEHAAPQIETSDTSIIDEADIFIYPGYKFQIVDSLLTNFHAPKSTVLMLAAAFAGKDLLLQAYQDAVAHDYRFLSYGDSMLII